MIINGKEEYFPDAEPIISTNNQPLGRIYNNLAQLANRYHFKDKVMFMTPMEFEQIDGKAEMIEFLCQRQVAYRITTKEFKKSKKLRVDLPGVNEKVFAVSGENYAV
jgi:hypothetical protein